MRKRLYLEGDERRESVDATGRSVRGALPAEEVARVLNERGRLPVSEYLRCRVRYFSDGAVFGGREYVEAMFRRHRERFGDRRKTGAREMRGLADRTWFTWRDLRLRVFGVPEGGSG